MDTQIPQAKAACGIFTLSVRKKAVSVYELFIFLHLPVKMSRL